MTRFIVNRTLTGIVGIMCIFCVSVIDVNSVLAQSGVAQTHFDHAVAFGTDGKFSKACKEMEKFLQTDSLTKQQKQDAYAKLAEWQEKSNNTLEAKYYYKNLLKYNLEILQTPVSNKARSEYDLYQAAYYDYSEHKFAPARVKIENLMQEKMTRLDRIDPYLLMARVCVNLNDNDSAKKYFKKILSIDKKWKPGMATIFDHEYAQYLQAEKEFNSIWSRIKRTPGNVIKFKYTPFIAIGVGAGVATCLIFCDGEEELPMPPDLP